VELTPTPLNAEVKEKVELYLYLLPLWAFTACSVVNFAFSEFKVASCHLSCAKNFEVAFIILEDLSTPPV
jgi:hypothetical protein